jgi:hypothetical protein
VNPNPGREIDLASYDGVEISNWIDLDPSPLTIEGARFALARSGFLSGPMLTLGPPTGRYNCHGLTFASRRTCIPKVGDPFSIDDLLARDRFATVSSPQIGDIITYRGQSGEIEHSGVVSSVADLGSVRVRSKWGCLEEVEHLAQDGPYRDYSIQYWRLA